MTMTPLRAEGGSTQAMELSLEQYSAVVFPDEQKRIGFTLRASEGAPIDSIRFEATCNQSDVYDVDVEQISETEGTLVVHGSGDTAGSTSAEVLLTAEASSTGGRADVVLTLEPLSCTLTDAPEENTYAMPAGGGTVELLVECNTTTPVPFSSVESWLEYDPSEIEVEEMGNGCSMQRHLFRAGACDEGTDARTGSVAIFSTDGFLLLEGFIRQEVDFDAEGREMVLRVRASAGNARTVHLPLLYIEECTVEWGDGTADRFEQYNAYNTGISHTYAEAGEYRVRISGHVPQVSSQAMPEASLTNNILAVEQWGNLGIEELSLRDITSLESIAPDTEGALSHISVFDRTFLGCTGLTSLPDGLFDHASSAVTFEATFYGCTGLTSLPDGLFEHTGATTFDATFAGCTGLTSLPADLFRGCTDADLFHCTFEDCSGLITLPGELFAPCIDATRFIAVFNRCTGLSEIPGELFASNPRADFRGETVYYPGTSYIEERGLFSGCTGLTEIPAQLFAANTQATDLSMAFLGCTGLTGIPADLLASNGALTDITSLFEGCSSIERVPEGLLDGNPRLEDVSSLFQGCSALHSVPVGLFDHNRLILQCYYTFGGCPLTGESPYTEIDGVKYHLYERSKNPVEFTVPAGDNCFSGCIDLDDYEAMPDTWR